VLGPIYVGRFGEIDRISSPKSTNLPFYCDIDAIDAESPAMMIELIDFVLRLDLPNDYL